MSVYDLSVDFMVSLPLFSYGVILIEASEILKGVLLSGFLRYFRQTSLFESELRFF